MFVCTQWLVKLHCDNSLILFVFNAFLSCIVQQFNFFIFNAFLSYKYSEFLRWTNRIIAWRLYHLYIHWRACSELNIDTTWRLIFCLFTESKNSGYFVCFVVMSVGHQSVRSLLTQVTKHFYSLQNTFGHQSVYSLLIQVNKHLYSLKNTKNSLYINIDSTAAI